MNVLKFGAEYKKPIAVALGFFDCIHLGHRALIEATKKIAAKFGGESALLTFSNDPSILLGGEKQIYRLDERAVTLEDLGLDNLICATFDDGFLEKSPIEFLDLLTGKLNIEAVVVGQDYRFGKGAQGDVDFLRGYCEERDILLDVEEFKKADGQKISTSTLKGLVKCGEVKALNALLSQPYFMIGEVEHARGVGGRVLGFPTANISLDSGRLALADGIYATRLYVGEKCYASMTNIGAKPTFDVCTPSIETYIFDFDGDLYGKRVKLAFYERTRDVTKFDSVSALRAQLAHDEAQIRAILSEV